ncbi:GNAT family N-acetyltransferase [Sphingobacterium suaedae]|uniref:GNAT family N-acetyltransferase n=1 Tax=Sphingobacterium suaedae TaxID=1686402 RepID=A0ABW5KC87_9SPHI
MNETIEIIRLTAEDNHLQKELATLTLDTVCHGASIGFMETLTKKEACAFWENVFERVARQQLILFVARQVSTDKVVGTIQLLIDLPANQTHRADVAKLQVHSGSRRQGIGRLLLHAVEAEAIRLGRFLLVLDTVTESAAYYLYQREGWSIVGHIPDYALFPNGMYCNTTYFFKKLKELPKRK